MSIKAKILSWQTALVIVVSLVTSLAAYNLMISSLRDSQFSKLQVIAQDKAQQVASLIQARTSVIERIAMGQGLGDYARTYNDPALEQYLGKFAKEFPYLTYVTEKGLEELTLVNGRRTDQLQDVSGSELFQAAIWERNRPHALLCLTSGDPAKAYVGFVICLQDFFDEFVGIIMARVPLYDMLQDTRESRIDKTGFLVVVDDKGTILSHPQEDRLLQTADPEGSESEQILADATAMKAGHGRAKIAGIDGYVAYYPVEPIGWSVIATLPYEEFMAAPAALRNTSLVVFVVVLSTCVAVAAIIASSITTGLSTLTAVTAVLAKGDLSKRVALKTRDEIGALGAAFNHMAERLDGTIRKLNTEIRDRERVEADLRQVNERLRQAQSDLVQSEKMSMLGELAAGVAHEINTPTGAILNVSADSARHLRELVRLEMEMSKLPAETRQWLTDVLANMPDMRLFISDPGTRTLRRQIEKELHEAGLSGGRRLAEVIISYRMGQDGNYQGVLKHLSQESVLSFLEHVAALKAAAEISTSSAEKISRIVGALRFYSRDVQANLVTVSVNGTIEDTLVLLQNRLKHIAQVKTHLRADLPLVGAGPELAQVWANILGNACDAIEESGRPGMGTIEITTQHADGRIVVTISNDGPPIPQEIVSRIFDPFFTTKPVGKGMGLGLSICAGVVQRCGGALSARNEPGWVVFEVSLPPEGSTQAVSARNQKVPPDHPLAPEIAPTPAPPSRAPDSDCRPVELPA